VLGDLPEVEFEAAEEAGEGAEEGGEGRREGGRDGESQKTEVRWEK
jgi:hypothetical protein